MAKEMEFDLLNLQGNIVSKDLSNYTSMLYAPAKFGKTTFAVNMFGQKGLILAWEIGYKGIKGAMAVPMRRWSDCAKITRQLKDEKVKEKFNVLIIDTMDLMYEAALAQILAINNVDSINKIGFGQGYTQLDNLIKNQLLEWQRLGYSIFVISHSINREEEVMMADGTKETIEKYVPTLNKRCFNLVNKFVDNIFFGNILMDNEGKEQRVLFTRETINYKAGSRFKYLPDRLPLDSDKVNEAIEEALRKEDDSEVEVENVQMFVENEKTFEEVKEELTTYVMNKFYPNDKMNEVTKIVESVLGIGCTVNDATEMQKDALEMILVKLMDRAEELGL
jgi:predicted  nucleic acid-binding Zn-ribbon protein